MIEKIEVTISKQIQATTITASQIIPIVQITTAEIIPTDGREVEIEIIINSITKATTRNK